MAQYDVVVVGLGAIGSAALHRLARRGIRVLGIERFIPGHDQAPRMARAASSGSAISSIRPMCRCCAGPMSCGASSRQRRRRSSCTSPASPRSARRTAKWWRARSRPSGCTVCRMRSWMQPRPCGAFRRSKSRRLCRRVPARWRLHRGRTGGRRHVALAQAAGAEIRTSTAVLSIDRMATACASRPTRTISRRARPSSPPGPGSRAAARFASAASRHPRRSWAGFSRSIPRRLRRTFPGVPARKPARRALRLPDLRAAR